MADAPKRKRLEKTQPMDIAPFNARFVCVRCGTAYGRQKGVFPVSHSPMYRGSGYLPWCNDCIDKMYESYRADLGDDRAAMRRMCMKMDLYWNDTIYNMVERTAGVQSRIRNYIAKTNIIRYIDKTFDNTIAEEGEPQIAARVERDPVLPPEPVEEETVVVPEDIIAFWGPDIEPDMYLKLEERYRYWRGRLPAGVTLDVGTESLLRQICSAELEINRLRAKGDPFDKQQKIMNELLGSALLKPAQQKDDPDGTLEKTPFGVWIKRFEDERPIPEADPELQDVDGIVRYITVWLLGHLCKMLGIKNKYAGMYEAEIERLRIERPELADEDDESVFVDIFGDKAAEEE